METVFGLPSLAGSSPLPFGAVGHLTLSRHTEDSKLIDLCRTGNHAAWELLIGKYEKPVYKFAYTLARNYDDAADIAAQVFVRLYENIHTFRNESSFTSWLFRIVRNVY